MTSEAIYRYLGRNPEYQPNSLSIVGGCEGAGFGAVSRREKFLEALGGGDLDFDDNNGHIYLIGGDDDDVPNDDESRIDTVDIFGAEQKLRDMFGGDEPRNEPSDESDAETNDDSSDIVLNSCPKRYKNSTTADENNDTTAANDINTAAGIIEEDDIGLTYGSNDTDLSAGVIDDDIGLTYGSNDTDLSDLFV